MEMRLIKICHIFLDQMNSGRNMHTAEPFFFLSLDVHEITAERLKYYVSI
jgi:hypothetical protein